MEISDLAHDERIALIGLSEMILLADGTVSEREEDQVESLVSQIGEHEYRALLDEFEARFAGEDEFKTFLASLSNQEARELIFETVLEEVLGDVARHQEFEILEWLRDTWHIDLQFEAPEPE